MGKALDILKYIRNNDYIMDFLDKAYIKEAIKEPEEAIKPKSVLEEKGEKMVKLFVHLIEDDKEYLKDVFIPHWHTHYIMDEYGEVLYTSDLEGVKARLDWLENMPIPRYDTPQQVRKRERKLVSKHQ